MVFSGPAVSFSFLITLSCCCLFWTNLFGGIHDHMWNHVQTQRLGLELLHLPLLHLPPPAEQVQTLHLVRLGVKVHRQTVGTGREEEGHGEVDLLEGEAAAYQRDVGVQVPTAGAETEGTLEGEFGGIAGIGEGNGGAVSSLEVLHVCGVTQTGPDHEPSSRQMIPIQAIQRPDQTLTGQGS